MKRVDSWSLREVVREHRLAPVRQRQCGRGRYKTEVTLETNGQGAWWGGVIQCRARMCPVCFIARRFRLAREIQHTVYEREQDTKQPSWLLTFTIRHRQGHPVEITREVRRCWRALLQTRAFRNWSHDNQIEWIAAEEVTRGENGWHPHIHSLILPRADLDWDDGAWFASAWLGAMWARIVERRMGREHVPIAPYACDLTPCDAAEYLAKIGLELADPAMVKGRSPIGMLADGAKGDSEALDRYMELQRARARARDVTFSKGLTTIRESAPPAPMTAELATVRGSQWTQLLHQGWRVPLDITTAAKCPESAALTLAGLLYDYDPVANGCQTC